MIHYFTKPMSTLLEGKFLPFVQKLEELTSNGTQRDSANGTVIQGYSGSGADTTNKNQLWELISA